MNKLDSKTTINRFINLYFVCIYIIILVMTAQFAIAITDPTLLAIVYSFLVWISYSLFYLLPAWFLAKLMLFINTRLLRHRYPHWTFTVIFFILLFSSIASIIFLYADQYLFSLYEYHIDSFVINLVTTPGGIESLGATESTHITMAIRVGLMVLLITSLFYILYRQIVVKNGLTGLNVLPLRYIFLLIFSIFIVQELTHGSMVAMGKFDVVQASSSFPLHLKTTFNSWVKKMGYQPASSVKKMASGKVHYPFRPLMHKDVEKPLNIVWLVAESLRADMLTAEIMPNVWEYSEKNFRFNHHYSGGNRTRMGMFSMFYGLYAPYWYAFEEQKISSPILDTLMSQNYQLQINTSQSFSYPELNHTVFVNVPRENMQELNDDPVTWKRDEKNITDILQFLDQRDSQRPFFNFMFFEATHAPYMFPDSDAIRDNYIREMNYAKLNLGTDISQIKNRYINAAHSVDKQIGRLLRYLEDHNLTDKTIVIITGDHGEEFMEKGHWGHGHNAVFPEEQIHVPMVLSIPGSTSRVVNYTTSHLDIPATILPMLGVVSDPQDYSFGDSLLAKSRNSFVVGNYNYISYIDPDYKLTFPFTGKTAFQVRVQKADDNLVTRAERNSVYLKYQNTIDNLFRDTSRFIL